MVDILYIKVSSAECKAHNIAIHPGDLFEVRKPIAGTSNIVVHKQQGIFKDKLLKLFDGKDWNAIKQCYVLIPVKRTGTFFKYMRPIRPFFSMELNSK